jgi:hypothetical protein
MITMVEKSNLSGDLLNDVVTNVVDGYGYGYTEY